MHVSTTPLPHRPSSLSFIRGLALLPLMLALGCSKPIEPPSTSGDGQQPPTEPPAPTALVEVSPAELPVAARFESVGNIGAVYRLAEPTDNGIDVPVPKASLSTVLPDTLRAFVLDEPSNTWKELEDTKYDAQTGAIHVAAAAPGYYTAFAWSSNPPVNALQRWLVDAQQGRRPTGPHAESLTELRKQVISADVKLRPQLVRDWVLVEATLDRQTCETKDEPACAVECQRLAGRTKLSSCPAECPAPDCCECQQFSWTERAYIPRGFLDALVPCPPGAPGCDLCPDGLSCAETERPPITIIAPQLQDPDYAGFDRFMADIVADHDLRDPLHSAVEQTVGQEYPVPPPWG